MGHEKQDLGTMVERIQLVGPPNFLDKMVKEAGARGLLAGDGGKESKLGIPKEMESVWQRWLTTRTPSQ